MNYIVFNDKEFYKDIKLQNFKEVSINGAERVDGVFGTITHELLEKSSYDSDGRSQFFEEQWLCGNSGTIFMVFRIPQDILYDGTGESLEKCFGFFNPESIYVEVGAIKLQNKENKYEYFLIGYNKNLGLKLFFDKEVIEVDEEKVLNWLCEKIEKKIL